MPNTLNAAALALNGSSEACRLLAYDDARPNYTLKLGDKVLGTLTIGWGHTGSDFIIGSVWTQEKADAVRTADLKQFTDLVTAAVHVGLSDNQFGVLVDFSFNVGRENFLGSTLLKKLNAGDKNAVQDQLPRWVYARQDGKKVKLDGLVKRRQREAFLWNTPDAVQEQAISAFTPATEPSVTAAPIAEKTLLTSAGAYLVTGGAALVVAGPELQSAATALLPYSDILPFIPHVTKALGLTAVLCSLWSKFKSNQALNNAQAT